LRLKSFEDLHKLWFVLVKERNLLKSERALAKVKNQMIPNNPIRYFRVRKGMKAIKMVLGERQRLYMNFKKAQLDAMGDNRLAEEQEIQRRLLQLQKDEIMKVPGIILPDAKRPKGDSVMFDLPQTKRTAGKLEEDYVAEFESQQAERKEEKAREKGKEKKKHKKHHG